MPERLEQLEQFARDEPHDPFNHYALALEYQKFDIPKALGVYKKLIVDHGDYIPLYYHYGKLLIGENRREEATEIFKLGIIASGKQEDRKALRELQAAYQELLDDTI